MGLQTLESGWREGCGLLTPQTGKGGTASPLLEPLEMHKAPSPPTVPQRKSFWAPSMCQARGPVFRMRCLPVAWAIVPILQRKKLSLKEGKRLSQGHTAGIQTCPPLSPGYQGSISPKSW